MDGHLRLSDAEPEFGSGLRAHLGRRSGRDETPPAPPEKPPIPAAAPAPDPDDLAAVAAELEERAARLVAAEAGVEERERHLAEVAAMLEMAIIESAEPEDPADVRSAGEVLRDRVERRVDLLWNVFEGALAATEPDGRPDHKTRLQAAATLLAAAYPGTATDPTPATAEQLGAAEDELARLRDRRIEWGHGS